MPLTHLALIALAGAAGTLCRFGLGALVTKFAGAGFPWGTLTVNVVGCFFFGFVLTIAEGKYGLQMPWRGILLVGFMGAFTTFSTFAADTGEFFREDAIGFAMANIIASNVLGILVLFAGMALGRQL